MKNRIVSLVLTVVLLFTLIFTLSGCDNKPNYTQVQLDINPSVELILDKNNKVVSVTALNDDGSVILSGEKFIGLKVDKFITKYVNLAIETGYISASINEDEKEFSMKVSGDSPNAEKVIDTLVTESKKILDKYGISKAINTVEKIEVQSIRETLMGMGYTEEELNEMESMKLIELLNKERVETADLMTVELRNLYYQMKDDEVTLARSEVIKEFMANSKNTLVVLASAGYGIAYGVLEGCVKILTETEYALILAEDSAYQKALAEFRKQKANVLIARKNLSELEEGSDEYMAKLKLLDAADVLLDKAEKALEDVKDGVSKTIAKLKADLTSAQEKLTASFEKTKSNLENADLDKLANDTDKKLTILKDSFFNSFEKTYKEDIKRHLDTLKRQKELLKSGNEA